MRLSRVVRAGARVGVGPSGNPPAELRTYETVVDAGHLPNPATRPEGSRVHQQNGVVAWDRISGVWAKLDTLASLYLPGFVSTLVSIVAQYAAGWRPGVVVHDAAFNAVSVTVSGLSAAKQYRFSLLTDDNGVSETMGLLPNSSTANCAGYYEIANASRGEVGAFYINNQTAGHSSRRCDGVVFSRRSGVSGFFGSTSRLSGTDHYTDIIIVHGTTTTNFTSLQFVLSATLARTGWLTVIEESP